MRKNKLGLASVEDNILYDQYGKWLWVMRRMPSHAIHWLTGIFLPPHERLWVGIGFADYKENLIVASRGSSKSFAFASLLAPHKALLYKNVTALMLSASGFRGGKQLFRDVERMFRGELRSQKLPGSFLMRSVVAAKGSADRVIQRDPSIWTINLRSQSSYSTVPTNNPEQLRGLRATEIFVDERNFFANGQEVIHGVVRPMLTVGQDFIRTATGSDKNKIFQFSTIDYTVREWYPEIKAAEQLSLRQYRAYKAIKEGDWDEYDRLMNENDGELKTASFSYTRIDYSDLIVPEHVTALSDGKTYKVNFPYPKGVTREDILKYDEHDKVNYFYLYPVDKQGLETPLRNGTADEQIWLAERRNCFIESSGNVFEYDLIHRIAERPIYDFGEIPGYENREEEFYAPILYTCGDPCVIGVDYARESDETAFVVIRLGELAEGEFDPLLTTEDEKGRVVLGNTSWNSIIWAESWGKMEAEQAANKIREMYERYNIIHTASIGGIALDQKGGGSAVRDALGNPKPPVGDDGLPDPNWNAADIVKMYDPEDRGGFAHYAAYNNPREYWGGLKLINANNHDNMDWTFGTRALMQQKKLYIGFWEPPSVWAREKKILNRGFEPDRNNPEFLKWEAGYNGIKRLKEQLIRIQRKHSETGVLRFVMPGDRAKEEGKKDLWAAMIYAVSLARQHLVNVTKSTTIVPMVAPLVVRVGSDYDGGDSGRIVTMYD